MNPLPPSEPVPPPSPDFVVGVRYSLPEMLAEIKTERLVGAYAMEKLDQQEIGKLFKPRNVAVPNPRNKQFVEQVLKLPNFDYVREIKNLLSQHGDTIDLLVATIDQKLLVREEACRIWSEVIGFAYVDPFASVITEEAIEKIPIEVAKKTKALGSICWATV